MCWGFYTPGSLMLRGGYTLCNWGRPRRRWQLKATLCIPHNGAVSPSLKDRARWCVSLCTIQKWKNRGVSRQWNSWVILSWKIHVIVHLPKHTEGTAPSLNPNDNYGLWMIAMHQCRFIECNKCTALVGRLCIFGAGNIWEIFVIFLLILLWSWYYSLKSL